MGGGPSPRLLPIARLFQNLMPAILRVDAPVTGHGCKNGEPTSFPAALQVGAGASADEYDRPAVKCDCGDPLTAPPA